MSSPFDQADQVVQRGQDGHHFYVRKKEPSHLPSFKTIFREAVSDLLHGHPSYWKEWKKQNKEKKRLAKEAKAAAKALSRSQSPPSAPYLPFNPSVAHLPAGVSTRFTPTAFQGQTPQPLQPSTNMANSQFSQPDQANGGASRGILKPELQRFSSTSGLPPMNGVPFQIPMSTTPVPQPPYQAHPGYPPQTGYMPPNPFPQPFQQPYFQPPPQMPPGPTQPATGWPLHNLPAGARAVSPPRYPTANDLKYTCAICNRFRSASYHYRHPLTQGQIPPKTICRQCRDSATDSDSEDSRDRRTQRCCGRRGRSRSVRRIESVGPYLGRASSHRRRASSRSYEYGDTYYDDENRRGRSQSRSSSVESIRRPRSRATSRSVVRHVRLEEPVQEELVVVRRPRRVRRVVYVDDDDNERYQNSYESARSGESYHHSDRRHVRAPTPAPRLIQRQSSDPGVRLSDLDDHRSHYDAQPPRRSHTRRPSFAWRGDSYDSGSGMENDWYANAPARRSGRSDVASRHHGIERPPTPAYSYDPRTHADTASWAQGVSEPARSSSVQRMERIRSRSRNTHPPVPDAPRQNSGSVSNSDDYNWIDKDGMRIRVREI